MKQPSKRPRATAKTTKKQAGQVPVAESPGGMSPVTADLIPPEVHRIVAADTPAQPALKATPSPAIVDPAPAAQTPPPAAAAQPQTAKAEPARRGGFVPLVAGGLIAGAIGFAAAYALNPPERGDLDQLLAAQDARITALQQDLDAQEPVDLAQVTQTQDDLAARLTDLQADLDALRGDLETRIADLPQTTDAGPAPDTSAFEAEIAALRDQLNDMTDIARTELDAARAEAASIEQNAAAAAANAAGRAALARLQVSVETGAPLGSALTDLESALGEPAPDTLLAAQDGVPTLAALQESFPPYARAALTAARVAGVSGENDTGVTAFLRNQFAVRSVNPRDGDTADAILSRAQAAVRSGLIADALTEINTLPDIARDEMAEWIALAALRADAVATIDTLATSLRDN